METKKELGITKEDKKEAMEFFNKAYSFCGWHISYPVHKWISKLMVHFSRKKNAELLERYNEAIEALEEANKDLIVLHGNIYQEIKKGNSKWEGVDEIIFKRIEANKQTISKSKGE